MRETESAGVHLESLDVKLQAALGPAHLCPANIEKMAVVVGFLFEMQSSAKDWLSQPPPSSMATLNGFAHYL